MARTVACAVKDLVPDTSWRLEMLSTGEIDSKPLQGWRKLGTGDVDQMSRKEQIAECLYLLSGEDVGKSLSCPSDAGRVNRDDVESNPEGNSDGGRLRIMGTNEGAEPKGSGCVESLVPNAKGSVPAPSRISGSTERSSSWRTDDSEFKNADSFVSEAEEYASKNEECVESGDVQCLGEDDVNNGETEAYEFQIFRCDDTEKSEPVSVFDLAFSEKEAEDHGVKFMLIASPSESPISRYMRIVDSWTIRGDEKAQLLLYVRDVKGTWCKLCTPAKSYMAVFDECHIILAFLECAVKLGSKYKMPHTYYSRIQKLVGVEKSKIRDVLKKYYISVVHKFVCRGGIPLLRDAQIIRNMKDSLRLSNETPNVPNKTLKSGVQRKIAMAIKVTSKHKRVMESYPKNITQSGDQKEKAPPKQVLSKRKRMVVSGSEDESDDGTDSEDLKPLLLRNFKRKHKVQSSEFRFSTDDAVKSCGSHEQQLNYLEGGRSETLLEVAELREPEVLKENPDIAEKSVGSTLCIAATGREKVEAPSNFQAGDYVSVETRGSPTIARIYRSEDDMPEDFHSDDEEVGDAAFCAICDDGGDLLFCDGPCGRSFHASKEAASGSSESKCRSLGLKAEEVKEMGSWLCPNCVYKRHQCFICGNLGSSEGENKEVFLCDVALCGRFYHPQCLGEFMEMSKRETAGFVKRIKDGTESVFCPAHKCVECGEGETEGGTDNSMKLAKCRRCPKAYHKICLPPSISFEETDDEPVRAWEIGEDDEPMKRLIIYCTDHIIDEHLNTPKRDHLRWPEEYIRKNSRRKEESSSPYEYKMSNRARECGGQTRVAEREEPSGKATPVLPAKPKETRKKPDLRKVVSGLGPVARTDEPYASKRELVPSRTPQQKPDSKKRVWRSVLPPIDTEAVRKRVKELNEMSASAITLESVHQSLFHSKCYVANPTKNFTRRGDLVSIINAARKAAEKIQAGNFEDAKRICPKTVFQTLLRTEDQLKVYLAPLLHGTRYTSYGRHFTNPDKLKEIIERIHWYIDDGDMVVDFCCGANDFSTLLKEKLDSVGKKCDFKNFDIHPPKNTFAFTKGDWFENRGEGFAEGKKLVMGLNPPFGSKAALATKFVLHALTFRPKLLVLIVPPETMDGGRKYAEFNYSLVWEDRNLLSGKSFYLPGSLDKSDDGNVAQWNNVAPPLFLWCPVEMLRRNQQIAVQQNHIRSLSASVPDVRIKVTRTPSPTGARDFDLRVPSGGLPSSSKSPLSGNGPTVPLCLPPQRSSSPDGLSACLSSPLSTPQSSSGSQGQVLGYGADPQLHTFKRKNQFDGRGPGAGFGGHYVPIHSDHNRSRMLIGIHGEDLPIPPGRREEVGSHTGVRIDHSGFLPTAVGINPATLTNIRLHGNPPVHGRPPFGLPPSPHPHSRPHSPGGMQPHPPPHLTMQPATGVTGWTAGAPPAHPPRFAQGIHGRPKQLPVHHGHGLQARPSMHPHGLSIVGPPGGSEFLPQNAGFPLGRIGIESFGRVPPPMGGMHTGGPPSLGSGGWIDD